MLWIQVYAYNLAAFAVLLAVFQLHVMDSSFSITFQFILGLTISLSTPCYGFVNGIWFDEFEKWFTLSTPCYGFQTRPSPRAFQTPRPNFQLHVMDSLNN